MRLLLFSHLFLAFCVIALTGKTILLADLSFRDTTPYLCIVFFSTLIAYNVKSIHANADTNINEKIRWVQSNIKLVQVIFYLSLIGIMVCAPTLHTKTLLLLLLLSVFAIGYSFPLQLGKKTFALRKIPYIKTLLVSIVWTIVVVYIPFIELSIPFTDYFQLLETFLFLFALAILFDIKDIEVDKKSNIRTIAMYLGSDRTKWLSVTILLIRLLLLFLFGDTAFFYEELFFTLGISFFIVYFVSDSLPVTLYMLCIDGILLLKCLVLLFSHYVN